MDVSPDVWGQLALEASQVYLTDGTAAKSPFAGTVGPTLQFYDLLQTPHAKFYSRLLKSSPIRCFFTSSAT